MRKLVIMRGHQGAGKSTLIRALGLSGHLLSPDVIRGVLSSSVMSRGGKVGISQEHDSRVWRMLKSILNERMERGELIVLDATHRARRDFKDPLLLAKKHRYEVVCMDFSSQPLELALSRNTRRPEHEQVPEHVIRKTWETCRRSEIPEEVTHFFWTEDKEHEKALHDWLSVPILDLSSYRGVCHIGDLQGCWSPLKRWLDGELEPDIFYIFVGDLCDRGLENADVIRFMIQASKLKNVRIHWGNHEDYLQQWVRGSEVCDEEFRLRTLPQLLSAGVTKEEVDALLSVMVDCTLYTWRGQQVMVTHAGLPVIPNRVELLSSKQLSHGPGFYSDPVDVDFNANASEGWIQVHGHRNAQHLPIQASPRSFNLEGQIEHGGHLRILMLDERGFTPIELLNDCFPSLAKRMNDNTLRNEHIYPPWAHPSMPKTPVISKEALNALQNHELIKEKPATSRPWVSAFNFTRDAFFRSEWDVLNITARGLFINNETGEIVARSYDKFFNVGERPETQLESLAENLKYPVSVYQKENGYLGILGYDSVKKDLFVASKSTPDSTFAGWFDDILTASITSGQREALRRYLRDAHASMVFEVIDPIRDPHIIEYETPQAILLDVIHRGPTFARASFKQLGKIAKHFGLQSKRRAMMFENWSSLKTWIDHCTQPNWSFQGSFVEGFVLEDQEGFLTKLKLDHYSFWKRMRSFKTRILRVRKNGKPLGRDISDPKVLAFYEWCTTQPDAVLEMDIITLSKMFAENAPPPEMPIQPPPPDPTLIGFQRMLDNLSGLAEGMLKASTADKLLKKALGDDRRMSLLKNSPLRIPVLLVASLGDDRMAAAEALGVDID